jgi:uncharacterized protein
MSPPVEFPPVFIEEGPIPPPLVLPAPTNVTAFVGDFGFHLAGQAIKVTSYPEFAGQVTAVSAISALALSVKLFFENGGRTALIASSLEALRGYAFNLLCIPVGAEEPPLTAQLYEAAASLCKDKRAIYLVDPPAAWFLAANPATSARQSAATILPGNPNAALYFPRLEVRTTTSPNLVVVPPSGAVAGVIARTDETRGVWKAPAGLEARLIGIVGFDVNLSDGEQQVLNSEAINCMRNIAGAGPVVWGARTRAGLNSLSSEWKYIPVRRLAHFVETSVSNSLQWTVFEPNDEPLWSRIRSSLTRFMNDLFRQGAFQGRSPNEAYFVKCDAGTTIATDVMNGIANIYIGIAPLRPAEFIVLQIKARTAAN